MNTRVRESAQVPEPFVANMAEITWQEFPGHFRGALSKALVRPETCGTRRLDVRQSCYQPMAHVEEHVHAVQEQVYLVLEGEAMLKLNGRTALMRRNDFVFVPPGVRHSIANNGTVPLVFFVITTPIDDGEAGVEPVATTPPHKGVKRPTAPRARRVAGAQ